MERGFVLSVVLILAAAMLAGNLGFDDSITGMQGTVIGTGAQSQEESCKQKCERDNDERKKKCMDVFTEKKNKIENKLKGCKNGAENAYLFCLTSKPRQRNA